jgi:Zn-dependent protease
MSIVVPFMLWQLGAPVFGAARPVPVNPRKYRNFRKGDIIVSLAGIAANFGLFVLSAGGFAVAGIVGLSLAVLSPTFEILQRMLYYGMYLNLILAFFNLIPIPPLDGSHVFYHLLPPGAGVKYRQLQALGFLPILVVAWMFPGALRLLLWPALKLMGAGWSLVGRFAISAAVLPS